MAKCMIDGYIDNRCNSVKHKCQYFPGWNKTPLPWSDEYDFAQRAWEKWNGSNYSALTEQQKAEYDSAESEYLAALDHLGNQYKSWENYKVVRQGGLAESNQQAFSQTCNLQS